ncbi:MAG: transglutaminase family protein, partial [Caulobacterales bacterium]
MKLKVHAALVYDFEPDTDAIVSIQAAHSDDQTILEEALFLPEALRRVQDPADERGERRFRCRFSGETSIRYEAIIDNGRREALRPGLRAHDWIDLPAPALQYLTASRYCPSDLFGRFAQR